MNKIERDIWTTYHWIKKRAKECDLGDETLLDMAEAIGCCNTLLAFIKKYKEK